MDQGLFLPGYGARARSYERGLPEGWASLQPPLHVLSSGSLDQLRGWLVRELDRRSGRVLLAGHSMGAALAVLAAAHAPDRVSGLVLVAPAGLPLVKPVRECVHDFLRSLRAGRYSATDVLPPLGDFARYPRGAVRLARSLKRLDLTAEMRAIRAKGIPSTVIACSSDTLTTPDSSRRTARLLGARYREFPHVGGHVWMFGSWARFSRELENAVRP